MAQYKLAIQIVVLAVLVSGLYVLGWVAGRHGCEHDFAAYKQQQQVLVAQQQAAAKTQELENEKRTYLVAQAYTDDLNRLNAVLLRMRQQASASSPVPAATLGSQGTHANAPSSERACEGTEFYGRALKAELMLEGWQKWAKEQKLAVQ